MRRWLGVVAWSLVTIWILATKGVSDPIGLVLCLVNIGFWWVWGKIKREEKHTHE